VSDRPKPPLAKAPDVRLALDLGRGVRAGLVSAFARMLELARATSTAAGENPEAAVHSWRKSLRRARSVVRFARPLCDPKKARALLAVLADAMRRTSSIRDVHVLEATLADVPDRRETRAVRARVDRSIREARASAGSTERVLVSLGDATRRLEGCEARFESALARDVAWKTIESSLRKSHRRVRRAWKGAERSRADAHIHEWRKRTKELRYELEMLASSGAPWVARRHEDLVRLAESLGEATDLIVLSDFLQDWNREAKDEEADLLLRQVRRLVDKRLARALERARPVLGRRPRKFAQKALRKVRPVRAA
jgi:CHAD domain-containing protein